MTRTVAALAAAVLVFVVYLSRLDPVAGLIVDDAWYILLAKALAQGDGYRLISSATAQLLPTIPPGFPLMLAPIVMAVPAFPDHVIWMKLLSIAAVLTAGAICWRDFTRNRGVETSAATLIVLAALLTPALVFLATSTVMAEGVYLLAQVSAVIAIERITRKEILDARAPIVAAILSAAAMLIRSSGAALIAAAVVYLLVARRWRQAAIFAVVCIACMLPWTFYAAAHAPSDEERAAHGGAIAYSYAQLLKSSRFSFIDPTQDTASATALMQRSLQNLTVVFTRDVGALVMPALYRGPEESGQEVFSIGRPDMGDMGIAWGTMIISGIISIVMLVGWFSSPRERFAMPGLLCAATLPMIAPVVGQTFRYLVPLAPYLLLFFWRGLRSPAIARLALLTVIGLLALDHGGYIQQKLAGKSEWVDSWRENTEVLQWIEHNVASHESIAATNPALIYLATNRRTVAIDGIDQNWARWKAAGVRFVASTVPYSELPPPWLGWREQFRSEPRGLWIVRMNQP